MSEVMLTITNLNGDSAVVDQFENITIALNWRFTDIAELSVKGSYSKQFRIPASPTNQNLFGPLFDPNLSTGAFSYHQKCPAVLSVGTIPITQGHVQALRTYSKLGKLFEYELVFYAETPDIARALGALKLTDVDYTALNHEISHDNVVTGNANWIYALCDRGQKWSQLGELNSRPVLALDNPVYPNEMTPCVSALWLFDKIISDAGFTYEGATLDDALDEYWLPYVNSKVIQTGIPASAYLFSYGYDTDETGVSGTKLVTDGVEFYDNGGDMSAGVWTAPFTGWFRFKAWATVDPTVAASNDLFRIIIREIANDNIVYISPQLNVNGSDTFNYQTPIISLFLPSTTTYRMEVIVGGFTATLKSSATNDPATGTGWSLVDTDLPIAGEDISFAANAPDMTQIDFLKSVVAMHNCVLIPDRNIPKKLSIIPIVEYLASGTQKDWTGKLDQDKDVVLSPTTEYQKRNLNFTYKAGSDVASSVYTKLGRIYGDYQVTGYTINSADIPNEFAQGDLKTDIVFVSTPSVEINGTNIPIPKFVNEAGDFQNPGARILYDAGSYDIALYDDDTLAAVVSTVRILSNYSNINPQVQHFDLNFAPEVPLYYVQGQPYNNLFNLYHREYLDEIYSPDARIMDAYFYLTLTDIIQFRFNDQIFVIDTWWRILEIFDYIVGDDQPTKVRLIKILNTTVDCAAIPDSTSPGGIISFVDVNGDPTTATEACCNRYGYFWLAGSSECSSIAGVGIDRRRGISGLSSGGLNAIPESLIYANNITLSPYTVNSLIFGVKIVVEQGNDKMLAVGDTLQMIGDNRGATALIGKNVYTKVPGTHLGGGWFDDDRSGPDGRAQHGVIMYQGEGNWAATTDQISLLIEGISGKHLELPDETVWNAELSVSIVRLSAGLIAARGNAQFIIDIAKSGGIARAGTITTVFQSGSMGTFNVVMDVGTNTAQSRLALSSTGGGAYPYNNIKITATLTYSQVKTT